MKASWLEVCLCLLIAQRHTGCVSLTAKSRGFVSPSYQSWRPRSSRPRHAARIEGPFIDQQSVTAVTVASPTANLLQQEDLDLLASRGYIAVKDFFSKSRLAEIRQDIQLKTDSGLMREAAIRGSVNSGAVDVVNMRTVVEAVRSTKITWLDTLNPRTPAEGELLLSLDKLRAQLSEEFRVSLVSEDSEVLYAFYPVGGFYKVKKIRRLHVLFTIL